MRTGLRLSGEAKAAKSDRQAAACDSVAFCVSNAQLSHGISFCMSAVSIVAPAQILRPDGASR
jgi:hypothetical protein